jgi:glycosyltransferase involved in cell wall biosynthesis
MIKVSIITVCYNSSETIEDTIRSVASQTYSNIEYIIIDGASKDDTVEIIKRNVSVVSKWISEKDSGIYDAMNKGVAMATGNIIGILNADDVFANERVVENIVKNFEDTTIDAVYADLKYVKKDDLQKVIRYWKSGTYKHGKFLYGWMPPHPTLYVKKEVYTKYGSYRLDMPSAADYEFMLRVIHINKIKLAYFPEVAILMREGGLSNSSIKHRIKANRDDKRAWSLNNVKPRFYTLMLKPLLKVFQFVTKS